MILQSVLFAHMPAIVSIILHILILSIGVKGQP